MELTEVDYPHVPTLQVYELKVLGAVRVTDRVVSVRIRTVSVLPSTGDTFLELVFKTHMRALKQGSETWLRARKGFLITGSRIPCLVGCHYESLNSFYQKKMFGKERTKSALALECMKWGSDMEELAYKDFLDDIATMPIIRHHMCTDTDWKYSNGLHIWRKNTDVAASPDGVGYRKGVPTWCLEIKCPYQGVWHMNKPVDLFRKKPQHWIQLQMNMACCRTPFGAFYVWARSEEGTLRKLILCNEDRKFVGYLERKIRWFAEVMQAERAKMPEYRAEKLHVPRGWRAEALKEIKDSVKRSVWFEDEFTQ